MAQQRGPQPKGETAEPARFVHCPPLPLLATPWRLLNELLEGELRSEHRDVLRVRILSGELLPVGGPAPSCCFARALGGARARRRGPGGRGGAIDGERLAHASTEEVEEGVEGYRSTSTASHSIARALISPSPDTSGPSVLTLTRGLEVVLPSAWPIVTAEGNSSGCAALKARNCAQALKRCFGRNFE